MIGILLTLLCHPLAARGAGPSVLFVNAGWRGYFVNNRFHGIKLVIHLPNEFGLFNLWPYCDRYSL